MPVVERKLLVWNRPREDEAFIEEAVFRHHGSDRRVVARDGVDATDENEPVVRVDVALVVLGQANVIFDLLVWSDPTDKQKVHEIIVEYFVQSRALHRASDS